MGKKLKPITWAGLSLSVFGYLLVLVVTNLPLLSNALSEQGRTILGLILVWLVAIILLIIVKVGEKRPFSSIGIKSITVKEILLAVGIGIVLSLAVPALTWLISLILPSNGGGIEEVVSNTSWWLVLISILTAGITEEIIFRGYLIERINEISKKNVVAIIVSTIAFVLPHTLSWNMTHVIAVVIPMGFILSLIYLWKRNLVFNMIIHIVIDIPLVVMTLMSV
jgi:membrane protease YdiL (CAAX protease family)